MGIKFKNDLEISTGSKNKCENKLEKFGIWKLIALIFISLCIVLAITLIAVTVVKDKQIEESHVPTCDGQTAGVIDLSGPSEPSVFSDLTSEEVQGLTDFIYSKAELNLVRPNEAKVDTNYVYLAELHLPNKRDVVAYLDGETSQKPTREARVVIFRGNQTSPDIIEIVVTPLPNPTSYRILREKYPVHLSTRNNARIHRSRKNVAYKRT